MLFQSKKCFVFFLFIQTVLLDRDDNYGDDALFVNVRNTLIIFTECPLDVR